MYYIRPSDSSMELPPPCDVFNCIVGNGSGGILVLFLGRFRMTTFQCLGAYSNLLIWLQKKAPKKGTTSTTTVLARFTPGGSGSSENSRRETIGAAPQIEEWGAKLLQSPRYAVNHFSDLPRDGKIAGRYSRLKRSTESLKEFDQTFERNLDLGFSAKSLTRTSLVCWVRLSRLLNILNLEYPISDCLTLVSTSKDPKTNILADSDFRKGGYCRKWSAQAHPCDS